MKLRRSTPSRAFTLLETMIALLIFFTCIFGVLELVSQNLKAARRLQRPRPNIGVLPAKFGLTNALQEGVFDIPIEEYPNTVGTANVVQIATNGLFRVDFALTDMNVRPPVTEQLSVIFYRPDSKQPFGLKR